MTGAIPKARGFSKAPVDGRSRDLARDQAVLRKEAPAIS
jgi:hypothetical protein